MVRPGFGFMRDGASLGMLREMLVMIRIWGLLKPGCLPTFTATSDNQDSMQLLFRLLTKLWLCCKNQTTLDPGLLVCRGSAALTLFEGLSSKSNVKFCSVNDRVLVYGSR